MPTTSNQAGPYPASTAAPNVPADMQLLAQWAEKKLVQVFASSADRATRQTAPTEGMLCWLQDSNAFFFYSGSAWVPLIEYPGAYASATAGIGQPGGIAFVAGTSFCRYQKLGRTVTLTIRMEVNGNGTGGVDFAMSIVGAPVPRITEHRFGSFRYFDTGNTVFTGVPVMTISGADISIKFSVSGNGSFFGTTPNIQAAAGDVVDVYCVYESAT